jgi:hypothetical protein
MSNGNPSDIPTAPRVTLKLKAGARKIPAEAKPQSTPALTPKPQSTGKSKPGAHWSDEYKSRMQADMDALRTR